MNIPVKTNSKIYFLFTVFVIFLVSFVFYMLNYPGDRYVLKFEQIGSNSYNTEIRYLSHNPIQGKIQCYIEELLLGPSVQRSRPLFSRGTQVEFCFRRKNILYLGLSLQAIYQDNEAQTFENALNLLIKNVKKNFSGVEKIYCFVDGNQVNFL